MDSNGSSGAASKQIPLDPAGLTTGRPDKSIPRRSYKRSLAQNHEKVPHKLTRIRDTYIVPIDKELALKLRITENDWVTQEQTEDGILLIFTERTKKR